MSPTRTIPQSAEVSLTRIIPKNVEVSSTGIIPLFPDSLSGYRGWLLRCSNYFLYGDIGLFIGLLSRKGGIWQPATNSFWQLATNRKIMSISATFEKNVAINTLSKYLNTRPTRGYAAINFSLPQFASYSMGFVLYMCLKTVLVIQPIAYGSWCPWILYL